MRILAYLLLIHFTTHLYGQDNSGTVLKLSGMVVDIKDMGIPFANVILFTKADSSLVTGVSSDENGRFSLNAGPGSYFIKVTFVSYEEKIIMPVNLSARNIDLGKITLIENSKMLDEVVVVGEKKIMELQLDKKVFNVSKDVSNIGANASEILENIPSVAVDPEGNVSLRGSQGVRILIDGKPSALTGIKSTDMLRNLQGAMIESIEVITNPSSVYDAEGETGIINIVLKKNRTTGFNGNFTGNTGHPHNYGASYSINYRSKKMNLFSNFGATYRKNPGKGSSEQIFNSSDTSFVYFQTNDRTRSNFSQNIMAGIDFYINDLTTLTGSFLYSGGNGNNTSRLTFKDLDENGVLIRNTLRTDLEKERESNTETSLSFRKKYSSHEKREWTADFKWTGSGEMESSDYTQQDLGNEQQLIQRSANPAWEKNLLFQTDYVHPYSRNGKIQSGFKTTIRRITNDFLVEEQNDEARWIALPAFNNNMEFTEKIYAAYLVTGDKINKFSYLAGIRGEQSDIKTGLIKTEDFNQRKYFNLFPSGSLSFELNKKNTLQTSYSYRISRPNYRNLTPFADFSNPRVYFVGNPRLNPEYTHSIEMAHLLDWASNTMLAGVYYRHKTGVIQRISVIDSLTGITNIVPINLAIQNDIGFEFNLSMAVNKWWKFNTNFNFFQSSGKGSYEQNDLEYQTLTWTNRTTTRISIHKIDAHAAFNYRAPRNTTQGKDLAISSLDLGLSRDIFKGRGTLTLNVRDVFNSRRQKSIIDIPGYYSYSDFLWRPRQINLTLNFRLNQQKIDRKQENSGDFDEN